MAIAAVRFKYLDKETNLGTKEFTKLTDNAVYTSAEALSNSALALSKDTEGLLATLEGKISDVESMVNDTLAGAGDKLKDALNSAITAISNLDMPQFVKKIFDSLKALDLSGVKSFFKEALHLGSSFLCHNLDFLKNFLLGFSLNKNILSGLVVGLLLSWLDRYCKGFTQQESEKASNRKKVDMQFPQTGVAVTSDNAYDLYSTYKSDFIKATAPIGLAVQQSSTDFLNSVKGGGVDYAITNLQNSEIDDVTRDTYLAHIDTDLSTAVPGSSAFNSLLEAKGKLSSLGIINETRIDNNIKYEHVNDKLGSFAKNLVNTNTRLIAGFGNNVSQQKIYSELSVLKQKASKSASILTASHETGSFDNVDFNDILPTSAPEEVTYLAGLDKPSDSHRLYDLHPTTEIFLEDENVNYA